MPVISKPIIKVNKSMLKRRLERIQKREEKARQLIEALMPDTESEAEAGDDRAVREPEPPEIAEISDQSRTQLVIIIIVLCVDHALATQVWRHVGRQHRYSS
jgi:hypothetical protein